MVCAEDEGATKTHSLRRALKARKEEQRSLATSSFWGIDAYTTTICPNHDSGGVGGCWSPAFPRGQTICTNAGGMIYVDTVGKVVNSALVIPPECLPNPGTTESECSAINTLWNTKCKCYSYKCTD